MGYKENYESFYDQSKGIDLKHVSFYKLSEPKFGKFNFSSSQSFENLKL